MTDARSFMVVGAGLGQVPAIQSAKQMGLRVVVVDRNPDAPGMTLADRAEPIDIVSTQEIVALAEAESIAGVMTMQSDLPVVAVAAVVDKLGIPGLSRQAAHWCTNKIAMRERLAECSIPQPRFAVARSEAEAQGIVRSIGLPVVIKSPESSGSRGVSIVREQSNIEQAFDAAMRFSPKGEVLVEEFVAGLELGAQTLSVGGSCQMVLIHDDQMDEIARVVPVGHSYPALISSGLKTSIDWVTRGAVNALGLTDGPANVDLIVDESGSPRVIEVGARIGATCLPELTSLHTGMDWVEIAIQCALGETPNIAGCAFQPAAARVLVSRRSGRLVSWHLPEELSLDGVVDWGIEEQVGAMVRQFQHGPDRIGRVLAAHEHVTTAVEIARQFAASIVLELE